MCVCTRLRSPQCGASATYIYGRYVCVHAICVYRLRHVRSVYLETAVSARKSKFIEPHDSSIRPSLLCQAIHSLSRGTELEITVRHPTFPCDTFLFAIPVWNIVWRMGRNSPHCVSTARIYRLLERPDNFLGRASHVRVPISNRDIYNRHRDDNVIR